MPRFKFGPFLLYTDPDQSLESFIKVWFGPLCFVKKVWLARRTLNIA